MPINGSSSAHLCAGSFATIASGSTLAALVRVITSFFIVWIRISSRAHPNGHHSPPSCTAPSCDDLSPTITSSPHTFSHPQPTPSSSPVWLSSSLSSLSHNKYSPFI